MALSAAAEPVPQTPFDVGEGGQREEEGGMKRQSAAVLASLLSQLTRLEPAIVLLCSSASNLYRTPRWAAVATDVHLTGCKLNAHTGGSKKRVCWGMKGQVASLNAVLNRFYTSKNTATHRRIIQVVHSIRCLL